MRIKNISLCHVDLGKNNALKDKISCKPTQIINEVKSNQKTYHFVLMLNVFSLSRVVHHIQRRITPLSYNSIAQHDYFPCIME